jgi:hypothetical protein
MLPGASGPFERGKGMREFFDNTQIKAMRAVKQRA